MSMTIHSAQQHTGPAIPAEALAALARVFCDGERPGRSLDDAIRQDDHIAHALAHLDAYQRGAGGEDHLAHAFARLAMAITNREREGKS